MVVGLGTWVPRTNLGVSLARREMSSRCYLIIHFFKKKLDINKCWELRKPWVCEVLSECVWLTRSQSYQGLQRHSFPVVHAWELIVVAESVHHSFLPWIFLAWISFLYSLFLLTLSKPVSLIQLYIRNPTFLVYVQVIILPPSSVVGSNSASLSNSI